MITELPPEEQQMPEIIAFEDAIAAYDEQNSSGQIASNSDSEYVLPDIGRFNNGNELSNTPPCTH